MKEKDWENVTDWRRLRKHDDNAVWDPELDGSWNQEKDSNGKIGKIQILKVD